MNTSKYFFQTLIVVIVSGLSFLAFKTFLPKKLFTESKLDSKNVVVDSLLLEAIAEDELVERARAIGKILNEKLTAMAAKYSIIGDVRGRGAMQAIEIVVAGSKDPNPTAMASVIKYCQAQGVLILTAGTYGNVIRFLPPLVISDELLIEALEILDQGFASL